MEQMERGKQYSGVNTKGYWEGRFRAGDWDRYGGSEQSKYFAQIALAAFPDWLKREMNRHDWTAADWGCAGGEGTAVLAREFPGCRFTGLDFSPTAVEKARERFPICNFEAGDLLEDFGQSDVIFSSNTLEIFPFPGGILEKLVAAARQHAVILLPLHDRLEIPEHFYRFNEDFFPLQIGGHVLSYFRIIDCDGAPLWPGEQLLLIYSAESALEPERRLSDLFSNEEYRRLKKEFEDFRYAAKREREEAAVRARQADAELENQRNWAEKLTAQLCQEQEKAQTTADEKTDLERKLEQVRKALAVQSEHNAKEIGALQQNVAGLRDEKGVMERKQKRLTEQIEQAAAEKAALRSQIGQATAEKAALRTRFEQAAAEKAEIQEQIKQAVAERAALQTEIEQAAAERAELLAQLRAKDKKIADALFQLRAMTGSRLFQLVHFVNRFLHQGFSHDQSERKKFRGWLFSRFRNTPDFDHRFHPLYTVINPLEASGQAPAMSGTPAKKPAGKLAELLHAQGKQFDQLRGTPLTAEAKKLRAAMQERKYKGILVYPHVVFWEPLQTPQQILRAFVQEGWLCFFCESQYLEDVCREVEPNLFITYERDLLQAVGDTSVCVLLTWMASRAFVDRIPCKTVWYHLLDHLEIFAYYDDFYRSLHDQTLATADIVSYVAGPLKEWTGGRADAVYLPNGANAAEISNVHEGLVPEDMAPIVAGGHKIIGYFGYLAEWMDYDLVRQLAIRRPEWEFVLVGKAIHEVSLIDTLPNVHLLGQKPYRELSDYAKFFDAATIPFLADEKMDCVSPIKFYEYLALGKPVVSSPMKELKPFADKWDFISCANGVEEFLFCLESVMEPENRAAAKENGPAIAAQNSWNARARRIEPLLLHKNTEMFSQPYVKTDVIVLSIIDFSFRHQRPQHFAQRLARNGHRVFYVNANFANKYSETLLEDRLWQVALPGAGRGAIHLTDWADCLPMLTAALDLLMESHSIRDAVIVADYPNWIHGALYLREKYGFCIVADYMDDFTGFLNPAEDLVRENCLLLLRESDGVVASSQFLYDIAAKYNSRVTMNRNGTEFEYFHQAFQPFPQKKKRKIIGYYGAIAEWFHADVVCRCAERFPDCDLVLVGNVTGHRKRLEKYGNIRLPGEVPYTGLLPWLESFDVCLIPFDASTELIQATNPVKFYEYLSAGKKIVATKIPELEPYSGRFAYLENDPDRFCGAVEKCLNGTDTLASPEECFAFARENDWDLRAQVFEQQALSVYPKISVIVVCYNQLSYTQKCVESVLRFTAYPNFELILVDNCSDDGTAGYLRELAAGHPQVKIVLNETNRGFAGGNNAGIAISGGEYLVLLNNDTIVTRGWLTGLLKHFRNDPSVGMVGPVTNSIGNEARICAPYMTVEEMPVFADSYTFQHMGEEYPHHGILAMFCVMISRKLYEKAGPLDEHYGIGMYEDDDYSAASERLGFRNVLAEDVFIHHFGNVSFKRLDDEVHRKMHQQNRRYFEKKWGIKWSQPEFRPGVR